MFEVYSLSKIFTLSIKPSLNCFAVFTAADDESLKIFKPSTHNEIERVKKMWILAMFINLIAKPDYIRKLLLHNAPIIIIAAKRSRIVMLVQSVGRYIDSPCMH